MRAPLGRRYMFLVNQTARWMKSAQSVSLLPVLTVPGNFASWVHNVSAMRCVSPEHLQSVAVDDDLLFTSEEFSHVKTCTYCLRRWEDCIRESGRSSRNRTEAKKVTPRIGLDNILDRVTLRSERDGLHSGSAGEVPELQARDTGKDAG